MEKCNLIETVFNEFAKTLKKLYFEFERNEHLITQIYAKLYDLESKNFNFERRDISVSDPNLEDAIKTLLLYGIDRDDGTGIHNERFWFLYENISKIELLEDVNAINIVTKEGCECVDETNRKVDLAEENNVFFIDDNSVRDFTIIIKRLSTYGFSNRLS